jgi:cell division septum initiation protein DivIVA
MSPLPDEVRIMESPQDGAATGSQELIDRIEAARFRVTRHALRYDESEVDDFLDKLVAELTAGQQLSLTELRDARFTRVRKGTGYTMQDVDAFLANLWKHRG